MTQPNEDVVTKSLTVNVAVAQAFRVWTEQIRLWWPPSHSLSGDPETELFIEGKLGGRFYERTSDGTEYDWGEVVLWQPPHCLAHTWYLGSGPTMPTRVEVTFTALSEQRTRIEIEHRGVDLIGELWWQRVAIFNAAWGEAVLPRYESYLKTTVNAP